MGHFASYSYSRRVHKSKSQNRSWAGVAEALTEGQPESILRRAAFVGTVAIDGVGVVTRSSICEVHLHIPN